MVQHQSYLSDFFPKMLNALPKIMRFCVPTLSKDFINKTQTVEQTIQKLNTLDDLEVQSSSHMMK